MKWYVLRGKVAIPADDLEQASREFSETDRKVASTDIGKTNVSTVFLGLDHNFYGEGDPILFETMIFGGKHDGYCTRGASWQEAMKMHEDAVYMVNLSLDPSLENAPAIPGIKG